MASWTISADADGSWVGSTYTSANFGNWIVTASLSSLYGIASLTVNHGTALSLTISPRSSSITAGQSQTFFATAYDSNGNNWDVTDSTTWSIDSGAGGSWLGNIYTSNNAGTWTVIGTYLGASSTTSIKVNEGPTVRITVDHAHFYNSRFLTSLLTTASDSYGNTWDVTSSTVWTIDNGAGGSWIRKHLHFRIVRHMERHRCI